MAAWPGGDDGRERVPALPLAPDCFVHVDPPTPLAMYYSGGDAPSTESLGERTIAGVRTIGRRVTTTLPRGAYGSDIPIQMAEERWVSADLRLVVFSRHQDTKVGVVEYQLTSIDRSEPASALFEVPNGWPVTSSSGIRAGFANPYVASLCQPEPAGRK